MKIRLVEFILFSRLNRPPMRADHLGISSANNSQRQCSCKSFAIYCDAFHSPAGLCAGAFESGPCGLEFGDIETGRAGGSEDQFLDLQQFLDRIPERGQIVRGNDKRPVPVGVDKLLSATCIPKTVTGVPISHT